jgi:hypothetical protein
VSAEDLLDKAMQGVFDPEAVRNVLAGDHGGDAEAGSAEDQRRGLGTASEQRYDGTPGRVVLREAWWTYKPLDSDGPAEDWLFIFSADARQLLLAQPAPYKFRPYSVCMPFAPVSGLAGDSLPSSGAGSIQRSLTTFIQLAIDMLTLGIHPYKMVSETLYSRFDKAFKNKRPGDYIKVPDEYFLEGGKGFQTYSPQTNFGAVLEMYSLLSQMGDKYTGANDALKGIPSPDKLTATQATQIMESSQKNAEQILESCAAAVGLTGQHAHELLRLYWQQQEVLELWQRVNPQFPIDACMAAEVLVTANGVAAESNKAIRAKRAEEIMMMAMNDPTTWSDPAKRYYILTNVSRELGVPYPENFWGTGDDYLQRAQLMAQQQAMAALPAPDGGGYALPA